MNHEVFSPDDLDQFQFSPTDRNSERTERTSTQPIAAYASSLTESLKSLINVQEAKKAKTRKRIKKGIKNRKIFHHEPNLLDGNRPFEKGQLELWTNSCQWMKNAKIYRDLELSNVYYVQASTMIKYIINASNFYWFFVNWP
jgi:hypothetical protein